MIVFKGTTGLNTAVDPTRLSFSAENGIQDLAACKNIDIDDTGRISRRKGFEKKVSGSFHSGFSCNTYGLCVSGDALTVLNVDYSTDAIRVVTHNARMRYVKVGKEIYYCNGFETGYVRNKVSYSWTAALELAEVTTRVLSSPPVGHNLCFFNGRIYIAVDENIYFSEPNSRNHFDLARSVLRESSRIRLLTAVEDGIYIGSETEITFYDREWNRKVVADYPAIEGTEVVVMAGQIGEIEDSGKVVLMATEEGLAAGFAGGKFVNFSEDKVRYPSAKYGAGIFKNRKYIVTLQP